MAQVTLRINGYAYTLGCKDGEEEHLVAMASELEQRIESVKAGAGQSGEARMLVMAGLLMADEVFELRQRVGKNPGAPIGPDANAKLTRRLNRVAKRAEEIAAGLEQP
jgi:cell division protein ZapA